MQKPTFSLQFLFYLTTATAVLSTICVSIPHLHQKLQTPALALVFCMFAWAVLRGPKVLSGLRQVRIRQREIDLQREAVVGQAAKLLDNRSTNKVAPSLEAINEEGIDPANLRKNWGWLLVGFISFAIGAQSLVAVSAKDAYELLDRWGLPGRILSPFWGWPIGITGLVFGLLCVYGSLVPIDD